MTLAADEFIRRFLLHILPAGFKHIRSYGLLANRYRAAKLATCRRLLGVVTPADETLKSTEDYRDRFQRLTGKSLRDCPVCGKGHMVCIETFLPGALARAPPRTHHVHRSVAVLTLATFPFILIGNALELAPSRLCSTQMSRNLPHSSRHVDTRTTVG
jgi:Putative transposase